LRPDSEFAVVFAAALLALDQDVSALLEIRCCGGHPRESDVRRASERAFLRSARERVTLEDSKERSPNGIGIPILRTRSGVPPESKKGLESGVVGYPLPT
jgi:hypothetical protein